jgi:hypothetical protein
MLTADVVNGKRESWPSVDDVKEGRSNPKYLEFARDLLPTIPYAKSFKDHSPVELMRVWFPVHLEAFGVALYVNGYHSWSADALKKKGVNESGDDDDDDELSGSSLTNETNYFPFTGNARGAKRFKGWKDSGVLFYNEMVRRLIEQRAMKETGEDFEENVMTAWASVDDIATGSQDREGELPMALNGLDMIPV